MKKRSISIISLITLFSINLISAQFYSGYNRFSLPDLLRSIDPQTMILGSLFLIFFILIFYPLSRVFKNSYGQPNTTIAGVLAFVISTLIIYGINRSGFDIEGLFYGLGLSSGILYIILPIILLIGSLFLIWKLKQYFLLLAGLLLIILALFTDLFYEGFWIFVLGSIMFLIGLIWWWKRKGRYTGVGRGAMTAGRYIGGGATATGRGIGRGSRWFGRRTKDFGIQREQRIQRRAAERPQRGRDNAERQAYKEEARRQEAQQKQIRDQQKAAGKTQKEREKAERQAYKEEARRQRKQQEAKEKAQREALEEDQRREETKRNELERQGRQEEYKKMKEEMIRAKETEKEQLTERQQQREKARKAGLREINQQEKMVKRQLKNKDVSKRSRKVLEQRIRDLENRRSVFKRYGVGKGNI